MSEELDLWRLLAGLGLFLFGMHTLEGALKQLAGRPFKRFLRQYTAKPLRGVLAGALSTAALQSSSVVSLIVLAFVGAGIISLASALGIVFGSNLGTTATGWVVATIGFKLDIEALALPLIAIGGFGVVWSRRGSRRSGLSYFISGFGLMLMGLEFMKSGALIATELFDPNAIAGYPLIIFLCAGFLVTAIIQSSSATIMITLSALFAGAIPLSAAAAVAIGADLGTTTTAILGALAGSIDKKRVAAAIALFNIVADSIAFLFLRPLLAFITDVLHIANPLFALVAFHSLINLIGIAIFLPLIRPLSHWLSQRFSRHERSPLRYITPDSGAVPEVAIDNATAETSRLIEKVAALNLASFKSPTEDDDLDHAYAGVKQLEGAILEFALTLQSEALEPNEASRLGQIIPAIRSAVHSAKSIKDVRHNLANFRDSVSDRFNAYANLFGKSAQDFHEATRALRRSNPEPPVFEALVELKNRNEQLHNALHLRIYEEVSLGELTEIEISTLLNVNRELYLSNQSLISALADTHLGMDASEIFESIPANG